MRGDGDFTTVRPTALVTQSIRADDLSVSVAQDWKGQTILVYYAAGVGRRIDGDGQQASAELGDCLIDCSETSEFRDAQWSPVPAVKRQQDRPGSRHLAKRHGLSRVVR